MVAVAADTDWKAGELPEETNALILNSRDDLVYQTEAQLDPEADWLVRRDRPSGLPPWMPDPRPLPSTRPTETTYPTGRVNQVEGELNAGRGWNAEDLYVSGHHPRNYVRAIRNADSDSPMIVRLNELGSRTAVERFTVRVPDRVPTVDPDP